jgi:thiamine-monophosphate kinase
MTAAVRPSEDDLIGRWLRPLATDPAALDLADDCARLVAPPGEDLILKVDAIAEGVHFFSADPWDLVARKALRVNLSDLAAKGARPLGYLMSLGLPDAWTTAGMDALAAGLAADQAAFGLSLLGGDTIRSRDGLTLSITVLGAVPHGVGPHRQGARPGDVVFLSGTLGDAALGLRLRLDAAAAGRWRLDAAAAAHLLDRYLLPRPRLGLAAALLAHAGGSMDVSDGLGIDLARLGRASGTHAVVDLARLPLSPAATAALAAEPGLVEAIVTGGDDYEIVATVAPSAAGAFAAAATAAGIAVTAIGRLEAGAGAPRFVGRDGGVFVPTRQGFEHF